MWAPEIRFFVVALAAIVLYALGWYTPVFRVLYAVLPGVTYYRRPADAVFLIGFLASVLSGYALHRLLTDRTVALGRRQATLAVLIPVAAFSTLLGLAIHFGQLEKSWLTTVTSAAIFATWRPTSSGSSVGMPWTRTLPSGVTSTLTSAAIRSRS